MRTLDADGKPISVPGTARILRVTATREKTTTATSRRRPRRSYSEPIRTDDQGRGSFEWTAREEGRYRVVWEARDAWEQTVAAREEAWIAGEAAGGGVVHNKHALLIPERSDYRIGDTARVLLVADEPGTTVLLTQELEWRILSKRVIRVSGRSEVLEIPLTQAQSPDVTLVITGIRGREAFRSTATLYVRPPSRSLAWTSRRTRRLTSPAKRPSSTCAPATWKAGRCGRRRASAW